MRKASTSHAPATSTAVSEILQSACSLCVYRFAPSDQTTATPVCNKGQLFLLRLRRAAGGVRHFGTFRVIDTSGGCRNSKGGVPDCGRSPLQPRPSLGGSGGMPAQKCVLRRVLASFGHFYMLYHPFLRLDLLLQTRSNSPLGCSHTLSCFRTGGPGHSPLRLLARQR